MDSMEPTFTNGSSKYALSFNVPPEFADILRDLTKEILRAQPKDINKFGNYNNISLFYNYLFNISIIY